MFNRNLFSLLALTILLAGCAATKEIKSPVPGTIPFLINQIDEQFNDPRFENAFWGVKIQSMKTGKVWYSRNANKVFMPASNQKIPTTAVTLLTLGEDFVFESFFTHDGSIENDVINGNIVVFANGDPTLSNRFHNNPVDVFKIWADALQKSGIKKINGNIIGDDNAFEDNHLGYGWSFSGLQAWYSAEVGALQLNENVIDIRIIPPQTIDGKIEIKPNLPSNYYTIINEIELVETGSSSVSYSRNYGENIIKLSGRVAAGSSPLEVSPSITNPTLFYVTVLKEVLEAEGIEITGDAVDCDDINDYRITLDDVTVLALHKSPPLKEILKGLMKRSQNNYAETMVRLLGWNKTGHGSFREGRKVVEEVLQSMEIEPGTYAFMDGSGLTRYNYISPEQIVTILTAMRNTPYWETWIEIQPVAGVDGTLRNRMKETAAEGNVKAKTGTIANVRGLSGYVTTADGEEIVFSFLVNSHLRTSRETEEITDEVLRLISEFRRVNI